MQTHQSLSEHYGLLWRHLRLGCILRGSSVKEKESEVIKFISRFTCGGKQKQVIEIFTCGCCYWFARILQERFSGYRPELVYDIIINHFGTKICGKVYDIAGDCTNDYNWVLWANQTDETCAIDNITRNCINF